jgi:FkbM family methyltransferase
MAIQTINKSLFAFLFAALFHLQPLKADYYEGVPLFQSQAIDLTMLHQFLPYNPIILEAGAFNGKDTVRAANLWPKARIFAFEPNPQAFKNLQAAIDNAGLENIETYPLALCHYNGTAFFNVCLGMAGEDPTFGYASSTLPTTKEMEIYCKGPQIKVPCMILDDWCNERQVKNIDLLRLELEGLELPVLRSSPNILKTVKVLYVKTFIHPFRISMTEYAELKEFLEESNFVLLSHRYIPGIIGHAIFLSRELFDAYFKLSLGIYLEV